MDQQTRNQKGIHLPQFADRQSDLFPRESLGSQDHHFFSLSSKEGTDAAVFFQPRSSVSRQQPHNNLFTSFKDDKPKEELLSEPEHQSLDKTYNRECLEYAKYVFDDRIRLIIRRIAIKAYQVYRDKDQHPFLSYCIEKMLAILSKKLLLNRFELLLLAYVFQETKWKYDLDVILKQTQLFKSFINTSEGEPNKHLKALQVYLLYCGYYSKKCLNEVGHQAIFNQFLKSVCPRFQQTFRQWNKISNVNFKISPKNLNNIFKRLTTYSNLDKEQIENYSLIVQEIIQISPAYNADKNNNKVRKGKKRKVNEPVQEQNAKQEYQVFNNSLIQNQDSVEDLGEMPTLIGKKQTSYMSAVDGTDPQTYMKNWQ